MLLISTTYILRVGALLQTTCEVKLRFFAWLVINITTTLKNYVRRCIRTCYDRFRMRMGNILTIALQVVNAVLKATTMTAFHFPE